MSPDSAARPGKIRARPVRHPGRWIAVLVILLLLGMLVSSFIRNPRWDWAFALDVMFRDPVVEGLVRGTLVGTVGAMILGVGLGVSVAVMRLSSNPVLMAVGATYTWFFRAVPRYVLLLVLGSLGYLYPTLHVGVPFGQDIARWLGLPFDLTFYSIDVNPITNTIIMGILGLGLSEAAYMAEIARAGILSVDPGQTEAAKAIGMSPRKIMWRIVLPQAMRVIVPPTGNETIAMVKDTSLLVAIPITIEMLYQAQSIGNTSYKVFPAYVAATAWYVIICSVLMVFQYFLERRFSRGLGTTTSRRQRKAARLLAKGAEH